MPEITATLSLTVEKIKAFTYNEIELNLAISTKDQEPYWLEAVYEVPAPLSLAPDKSLLTAKTLIGILEKEETRQKRAKIYAGNDAYPEIYKLKVTLYIYDKDGAISERKEYVKEVECADMVPKIPQNTDSNTA